MVPWRTTTLVNEASRPYLKAGPGLFAYFYARGKLRGDPVYRAILERGLLAGRERILDLGCGQALLSAWIRAAANLHARRDWPAWPPPPSAASIRGIELMPRDVERARHALGADAGIEIGDIRRADFGSADAVVMLDVMHYLDTDAQWEILRRIRAALPTDGLLLLRVGDAAAGWRHRYAQWVDRFMMRMRGHDWIEPYCRSLDEWRSLLALCDFDCDAVPMSDGTPFANVLIIARVRPHQRTYHCA